jgi:large subunit ribosomal protein L18
MPVSKESRRLRIKQASAESCQELRASKTFCIRSNKGIYAQLMMMLPAAPWLQLLNRSREGRWHKCIGEVGKLLASKAIEKGLTEVVFDRSGYLYHGRIKS